MELYLDVKPIGKGSKGRTACGSAAYRSCDKVVDNNGRVHNYQKKSGHIAGGIELPKGAPSELLNSQTLWQLHDAKETRKDAQIYREVVFALPNELPDAACIKITKALISPVVDMGMCAQWDIHNPHDPRFADTEEETNKKPENKHVHVMLTMRELQADGTFGNKNRTWNKYNGGINLADMLRPEAARLMNEQLEAYGFEKRVEHESYVARGIDKIPQMKIGVAGAAIDRNGGVSYRKAMADVIKKLNQEKISYDERLKRAHEARKELANIGIKEVKKPSLFTQIEASGKIGEVEKREFIATYQERIETYYANIKQYNQQIYDLRKEKKQNDNNRKALYVVKNLVGVSELTKEQTDQLRWAEGYLKWALRREDVPTPSEIETLIEEARERNTERCLGIYAAEKGIKETLQTIQDEQHTARSIRKGIELLV